MFLQNLLWTFKRHPFLYLTRFRLLSKNSNEAEISGFEYNALNKKVDIPEIYHKINSEIFKQGKPNNDLDLVKQLSVWLREHIKGGPGLSVSSDEALELMLSGKGGVCSDMAQIFNNFCVINDIQVREWGTTSAPFNRAYGGHSFNEVFCKELNKWVLIDVSWCILFYNGKKEPLSVIEVYQLLRSKKNITYTTFNSNRALAKDNVYKNYLNPFIAPFLICDYRNKTYDSFLKAVPDFVPVFVIHFLVYIFGKSYYYRFPINNYKLIFSKS